MKEIYAASLGATNDTTHSTMAGAVRAENKSEASRRAMEMSYRQYPKSDGWKNHHAEVAKIPDEWLQSWIDDKALE